MTMETVTHEMAVRLVSERHLRVVSVSVVVMRMQGISLRR